MARIRCHYLDCVFLDEGYCSAAQIELDPDAGCGTYSPNAEAPAGEDWEDEEAEEWEELSDEDEDEDESWLDEEDADEY